MNGRLRPLYYLTPPKKYCLDLIGGLDMYTWNADDVILSPSGLEDDIHDTHSSEVEEEEEGSISSEYMSEKISSYNNCHEGAYNTSQHSRGSFGVFVVANDYGRSIVFKELAYSDANGYAAMNALTYLSLRNETVPLCDYNFYRNFYSFGYLSKALSLQLYIKGIACYFSESLMQDVISFSVEDIVINYVPSTRTLDMSILHAQVSVHY